MLDVIIIGAGPIGIFAGYYLKAKGLNLKILEATQTHGGQLNLYLEKNIKNIPGQKTTTAKKLSDDLLNQLGEEETIIYSQEVKKIIKHDTYFKVITNTQEYQAHAVLLATGKGGLIPRTLGLDKESELTNIHYHVKDLSAFSEKRVAIFGGGDSALDWALHLVDMTSELHLIHRRNDFRAHQESVEKIKASKANVLTPYTLNNIIQEDNLIKTLQLTNKETGEEKQIDIDAVICSYGFVTSETTIDIEDLSKSEDKVEVDRTQSTNIAGIFAIGDACYYQGKNYNLTTGFGEASVVANNIILYLDSLGGEDNDTPRTIRNY